MKIKTNGKASMLQVLSEGGGQWADSIQQGTRLFVRDDSTSTLHLPMKTNTNEWYCWLDMPGQKVKVKVYDSYSP